MNNLYTWLIEIKIKLWTKTSKFWIEIFSWDWEIGIICWIWISNVTIQIYRHRPLTIKIWTGRGRDILASVMATVMLLLASLFLKSLWRMFHVCWKPLDITADSLNLNTWKLKNAWYTNDNWYETAVSFLVTRDLIDQSGVQGSCDLSLQVSQHWTWISDEEHIFLDLECNPGSLFNWCGPDSPDEAAELAGVLALAAVLRVPPVTTRGQNYPGLCDTTRLTWDNERQWETIRHPGAVHASKKWRILETFWSRLN